MFKIYLLVISLTCIFTQVISTPSALEETLHQTTEFFESLKRNYEKIPPTPDLIKEINIEIASYMTEFKKSHPTRYKRQLSGFTDPEKAVIEKCSGFEEYSMFNSTTTLDLAFYVKENNVEQQFLAVSLDSAGVSLFIISGISFIQVASYALQGGKSIAVDSTESSTIVLVIEKFDNTIVVLKLLQTMEGTVFYFAQDFNTPAISHLTLWRGMNQLFLGVASSQYIHIYRWLGETFDLIQTIRFGAETLVPFTMGSSMHLVATGSHTIILHFLLGPNKFTIAQRLPATKDTVVFHFEGKHLKEYYLALANEKSTVLYKHSLNRFVPFQEIEAADRIFSLTTHETALIISQRQNEIKMYQYDGWKFVELDVTILQVQEIRTTFLYGEPFLAIRYTNGLWKLNKPIWKQQNTWENLREDIKAWCTEANIRARRILKADLTLKGPIRILNGHIKQLHCKDIKQNNVQQLLDLTYQYKEIVSKLDNQKKSVSASMMTNNTVLNTLTGRTARMKCKSYCKAERVTTGETFHHMRNLRKIQNDYEQIKFQTVRIGSMKKLQCPIPSVDLNEITVTGVINGIQFSSLEEDALCVTGDQEITAEHVYATLNVTGALIPIGIATQITNQDIQTSSIKVKNLNLTQGGILLPLNGDPATISGTMTISKLRTTSLIDIRGQLKGKGASKLKPRIHSEPGTKTFTGDYTLQRVEIIKRLEASELTRSKGKSLSQIVNDAVLLDQDVPVHLILSSDNVVWSNVTLLSGLPFVTTDHRDSIVNITGTKYAPFNVSVTESMYNNLALSKLKGNLCSTEATSIGIETYNITIDQLNTKSLNAKHVYGAPKLDEIVRDSVTSFNDTSLNFKNFLGTVKVSNALVSSMEYVDLQGLQKFLNKWVEPGILKGPVKAKNLVITNVITNDGFKNLLPQEVNKVTSKKNTYVGTINGVNIVDLMRNVVRLDDIISLTNITFEGGFIVEKLYADHGPINFSPNYQSMNNLGSKTVDNVLKTEALSLPLSFSYPIDEKLTSYLLYGSATFPTEPTIENVNGKNLKTVYNEIWLRTRPTNVTASNVEFKNVTFEKPGKVVIQQEFLNTPRFGSWKKISSRILSKTKSQNINVQVTMRNVEMPNLVGSNSTTLWAPNTLLDGIDKYALRRNNPQIVTGSIRFENLEILGNLDLRGKVNGLNLSTDVVRSDVKQNVITGNKIVQDIFSDNINGLKFSKWAQGTLRTNNSEQLIILNGRKTFKTVEIQDLRVFGTIMGRKIENALLKSSNQRIPSINTIHGNVRAPALNINGPINDVNLTNLVEYQLKKQKDVQIIKTSISLRNGLEVLGNVTIDGFYEGVELKSYNKLYSGLKPVIHKMSILSSTAEGISRALKNRASYWHKLELLEENSTPLIPDKLPNESIDISGLENCKKTNGSLLCNNEELYGLVLLPNAKKTLLSKVVVMAGELYAVHAVSDAQDSLEIYRFDISSKEPYLVLGLSIPGAIKVSLQVTSECLWLAIQFPLEMMILRYETWGEYQEYVLPGSDSFLMKIIPTNELLLSLSSGVWRLGGIAGPRKVFSGDLHGKIEGFIFGNNYYLQLTQGNTSTLLQSRYVGNK
ncbi:uncharacterized protein LOC107268068 [Cephus cinctus]|uniref:Uncharacterized protein LOC107268068 n=1 Tax=Cephus cinctus TaxID=211228 RepID=A0AAJ7BWF1_CEPCN|nr:uncharacterized protein LOC107268068 [Cephus cinctus]